MASAPACQLIGIAPVVFLGTVMAAEPDALEPESPSSRVYRVRVDRAYQGLPDDTGEVMINPDNGTSCRREYEVGKQYVMFTTASEAGVYMAGGCSGSRRAEFAASDIEFLETLAAGRATTRVYGKTLQWVYGFGRTREDEQAPVAGAHVTLRSKSKSWEAISGPDGGYSFEGLKPGEYRIHATLENFSTHREPRPIELSAKGCAETFLELRPRTELSGVVLDYEGKPAERVRIELMRRNPAGEWYATYEFWTQSDEAGRFRFAEIPTGEYLVGYSIWQGRASFDSAVPSTYYPGVPDKARAATVRVENEGPVHLNFRLERPQTPRQITVDVTWTDGKPAGPHLLQIAANGQGVKNIGGISRLPKEDIEKAPAAVEMNSLTFTGFAEREYQISARYWVDDLGGPTPHDQQQVADTNVVSIEPGIRPASVHLILGWPKRREN